MVAIVNVTANWGIGLMGRQTVMISEDLKRFRALTTGKTVVLGRKTLETFPGGKPLKNRRNIIMSTNPAFSPEGSEVVHSLPELLALLRDVPTEEVCIIGGATLYEALLPYCHRVLLTKTHLTTPADRFFPNLDELPNWKIEAVSSLLTENGISYQYIDYVNQTPAEYRPAIR